MPLGAPQPGPLDLTGRAQPIRSGESSEPISGKGLIYKRRLDLRGNTRR